MGKPLPLEQQKALHDFLMDAPKEGKRVMIVTATRTDDGMDYNVASDMSDTYVDITMAGLMKQHAAGTLLKKGPLNG